MITEKKLMDIVEKLLAKAKADQVRWQRDDLDLDDDETTTFSVQFKESRLYVQYVSPPTESDGIEIGIKNNRGDTIKRVYAQDDDEDQQWRLFVNLYQEAERSVTGSDRVLDEIEEELKKEGAIGLS